MSAQERISRELTALREVLIGRRVVDVDWIEVDSHEQLMIKLDDGRHIAIRSQHDIGRATWLGMAIGTPID